MILSIAKVIRDCVQAMDMSMVLLSFLDRSFLIPVGCPVGLVRLAISFTFAIRWEKK